jgi:hypothetical protein
MGATVWQVNSEPHVVTNFVAYHNGRTGVYNGAYGNPYNWSNLSLYANGGGSDEPFEETQFLISYVGGARWNVGKTSPRRRTVRQLRATRSLFLRGPGRLDPRCEPLGEECPIHPPAPGDGFGPCKPGPRVSWER